MRVRLARFVAIAVCAAAIGGAASVAAQWIKFPTAGVPRLPDGKPNLAAPPPRLADGYPACAGMWFTDDLMPCAPSSANSLIDCGVELRLSRFGFNMPLPV